VAAAAYDEGDVVGADEGEGFGDGVGACGFDYCGLRVGGVSFARGFEVVKWELN
jgi:hypothetical protein